MKKIGIITFHNSYNCGSMLESYAMQKVIEKRNMHPEIVNFSSNGQKELYSVFFKNKGIKNIIKNILILPHYNRIKNNNNKYEEFKNKNFRLSKKYTENDIISEKEYDTVIAGSDQIWNITIKDASDVYFLNWVNNAKKVAYAPSFGAKNILKYSNTPDKYKNYIDQFDALSIRENNGKKWIKDLCNKDIPVLIDPTLLLNRNDYEPLEDKENKINGKYIFFYCPSFDVEICKYVKQISKKYNLQVITWSTKSYITKRIRRFGFKLPKYENPSMYLSLIKNAELVITTSFHGTIFSTIYRKKFITVKNGEMYGDDDRVKTLLEQIKMINRLLPYEFNEDYDYLADIDYAEYDAILPELQKKANEFLDKNVVLKND
jgi:hypothetical protein